MVTKWWHSKPVKYKSLLAFSNVNKVKSKVDIDVAWVDRVLFQCSIATFAWRVLTESAGSSETSVTVKKCTLQTMCIAQWVSASACLPQSQLVLREKELRCFVGLGSSDVPPCKRFLLCAKVISKLPSFLILSFVLLFRYRAPYFLDTVPSPWKLIFFLFLYVHFYHCRRFCLFVLSFTNQSFILFTLFFLSIPSWLRPFNFRFISPFSRLCFVSCFPCLCSACTFHSRGQSVSQATAVHIQKGYVLMARFQISTSISSK
jgi:hypothetical protein